MTLNRIVIFYISSSRAGNATHLPVTSMLKTLMEWEIYTLFGTPANNFYEEILLNIGMVETANMF